eukprot:TRINITY_DN4522_c0_g1_i5.p1 TRINITY_DN4522_c0_g1~~TRINITY_DN4522_c0_g1_i5.p1  ORF type:complete len:678 (+),score=160.10 TRINITY_DN4522_c0_g1_i5:46-2079(+)
MKTPRAEPVPRLYKVAANVYRDYNEGKDSVKNLVYQAKKKHPNIKAIYALVMEAVNHATHIDDAFKKIELFEKEPRFQKELACVLITELLFGKKTLPGTSLPVTTALKYHKQIKKNMEGELNFEEVRKVVKFPKYARVNSLCNSLTRVSRHLRDEGWLEIMYDKESTSYSQFLEIVRNLKESEYVVDYHIQNLIVFPPKTQLYDHALIEDGSLLLQDKGSCMPVEALSPPPGSCVLDACSAPGMKTSQIASKVCGNWVAVLGGKPPPGAKVIAVERSTKRCQVLRDILQRSRGDKVTTVINQNFLEIDPQEYSEVDYIVVDPSCSGDGMVNRNALADSGISQEKLANLCFFQKKLLRHALSFPNVKKVVYSTCSLTREENEGVLEEVLSDIKNWKIAESIESWERRGEGEGYSACLRTLPYEDLCNGFFVAVLERTCENSDSLQEKFSIKEEPSLEVKSEAESNPLKAKKKKGDSECIDTENNSEKFSIKEEPSLEVKSEAESNPLKAKKKKGDSESIDTENNSEKFSIKQEPILEVKSEAESNPLKAAKSNPLKGKKKKGDSECIDTENTQETVEKIKHKKNKKKKKEFDVSNAVDNDLSTSGDLNASEKDSDKSEEVKPKKSKKKKRDRDQLENDETSFNQKSPECKVNGDLEPATSHDDVIRKSAKKKRKNAGS